MAQSECEKILSDLNSWATLQKLLPSITDENDLVFMMRSEKSGKNRIKVLERVFSRYSVLRREREHRELSAGILPF